MRFVLQVTVLLLLISLVGCGSGSSNSGNGQGSLIPPAVSVAPATVTLPTGGNQTFTATVIHNNNTAVTWSVKEAAGGTIDANGNYVAPNAAGTYHVVATSVVDTTKFATAAITVVPPVTISPTTATVVAGGIQTFTAQVAGVASTAVNWSVKEAGGGSINANGQYTAPATPGTYHVVVANQANTNQTATATVTVVPNPLVISPTATNVSVGGTVKFSATFNGVATTAINWSVQEGTAGGTIDANGNYTAPVVAGTYHVIATSKADATKQVSATVTAQAGGIVGTVQ